jgi:hypothetical protein
VKNRDLAFYAVGMVIGGIVARLPAPPWPKCPEYRITTEKWHGDTVFWIRRASIGWPFCHYRLDSPALARSLPEAERIVAARRAQAVAGGETIVREIP